MPHAFFPSLPWATSCLGDSAEFSLQERTALGTHVYHCSAMRWRLDGLRGAADMLQGMLASRTVTCAVVMGLLGGAIWLVL